MKLLFTLSLINYAFCFSGELKLKHYDNMFLLPEDVTSFNVKNILGDTQTLNLKVDKNILKKKLGSFTTKLSLDFSGEYILGNGLASDSRVKNRDDTIDSIKSTSMQVDLLGYSKYGKSSVFFSKLQMQRIYANDLQFDFRQVSNRSFDYFLLDSSHNEFLLGVGLQSRLSKKVRFDAEYNISINEYDEDYSFFELNDGQSNDHLLQQAMLTSSFKATKKISLEAQLQASYWLYQNRLALDRNGYFIQQGINSPDRLIDGLAKLELQIKTLIPVGFSIIVFEREDLELGGRSLGSQVYSVDFKYNKGGLSNSLSYSYKRDFYPHQIASLIDPNDTLKLQDDTQTIRLSSSYNRFEFDLMFVDRNSTREYNELSYFISSLSIKHKF